MSRQFSYRLELSEVQLDRRFIAKMQNLLCTWRRAKLLPWCMIPSFSSLYLGVCLEWLTKRWASKGIWKPWFLEKAFRHSRRVYWWMGSSITCKIFFWIQEHLLTDASSFFRISVVVGLIAFILMFTPEIPLRLRPLANGPYVVVVNIMACRVFRRTRTGMIRESQLSTTTIMSMGKRLTQLVDSSSNNTSNKNRYPDTAVLSPLDSTPIQFCDAAKTHTSDDPDV